MEKKRCGWKRRDVDICGCEWVWMEKKGCRCMWM